jgi:digeranylgeranylglycerophospholipid reductase
MKFKNNYDVIVVGGGPAGSLAALHAARGGADVLLLEKDREIGSPVRCAEAIGKDSLEKILQQPVSPSWIAATITKFLFVAPDGTRIYPRVNMTGFVLNRKIFDLDLARLAGQAGAQIETRAYVYHLLLENKKVRGVKCRTGGQDLSIGARIVIGADGVESRVGRWAGIDTTIRLKDMETCAQATLGNVAVSMDACIFYFSQQKFPGGYGWVFPKGNGMANVGLGIAAHSGKGISARHRLESFIRETYPDCPRLGQTVGGVPCANRLHRISGDGILLAGDAAWQSNPISGGGISTAMAAGKLAGSIAAEAVRNDKRPGDFWEKYEKEWDRIGGKAHRRNYRIKEAIRKLSDQRLNETAHAIQNLAPEKQTLLKIFQKALVQQPALLLDIIKAMAPFS